MTDETVTLIDDSVLRQDPGALSMLSGRIILPEFSLRRLSNPKNSPTALGIRNAEAACSFIEQLTHEHPDKIESGMPIEDYPGTTLAIFVGKSETSDKDDTSRLVISAADKLSNKRDGHNNVVVVSQNRELLVRARVAGYEAKLYQASLDPKNFYSGHKILNVDVITNCDKNGEYAIYDNDEEFSDNECVSFVNLVTKETFKTIYSKTTSRFAPIQNGFHDLPVSPLNLEQEYAFALLRNPNIDLVTLDGPYGTGKDLCALSYALSAKANHKFKRIVLIPSSQPVGDYKHETLPGDLNEKNNPYMGPYIDNINSICRLTSENHNSKKVHNIVKKGWVNLIKEGDLEVAPLAYMRGRTFDDCIVIFTEAQNISQPDMRLFISRIGINSKFVFTGDIAQLDTRFDFSLSGYTRLIDRFKDDELVGHIKLVECVRSRGARLAAKY